MDNFVINDELARLISEYCCSSTNYVIGELLGKAFGGDYDKENFYNPNLDVLIPLEDWEIKIESGDHIHDSDNADYTFTLKNPKTGDYFIGSDNHNLCSGWNAVTMEFHKFEPKKKVKVKVKELKELLTLCDAWDMNVKIFQSMGT